MRPLLLAILILMPVLTHGEEMIWEGTTADRYKIRWTTESISVVGLKDTKAVFATEAGGVDPSAHRFEDTGEGYEEEMECQYGRNYVLLSVVGSYITFSDEESSVCVGTAHPSYRIFWMPVNLNDPPTQESLETLDLTDFFSEKDILQALKSDSYVQKALSQSKVTEIPDTLKEFVDVLVEKAGCEFGFDSDMLTRFAFHHLEGDRVAVRLGVSNISAHVCNKEITELGLLLPIPASLRDALAAADSRAQGYLMKDVKNIAGNKSAGVGYDSEGPISFKYQLHPDLPEYYFILLGKHNQKNEITITRIRVADTSSSDFPQNAEEIQTLTVVGPSTPYKRDDVSFLTEDLNFDGYDDIGLETRKAEFDSYYDYWLFDPDAKQFKYLGNYLYLIADKDKKQLTSGEETYQIKNGKLIRIP